VVEQVSSTTFTFHSIVSHFRFYNRLPEVRKKREEDARTKEYATNRERAKQYQQVHRLLAPYINTTTH